MVELGLPRYFIRHLANSNQIYCVGDINYQENSEGGGGRGEIAEVQSDSIIVISVCVILKEPTQN